MTPSRRRTLVTLAIAAIAGTAAGIAIGVAGDDEGPPDPGSSAPARDAGGSDGREPAPDEPADGADANLPPPEQDPGGAAPGPSGAPPSGADEEAAASAARGYVQALDRRSGAAVCRAFAPGALDRLEFPARRATCRASVEASLGFARRGRPVWRHSEMTDDVSAEVTGDTARVVATVFTVYADVREPTIEDDIIQLERVRDRWLVAKPSLTLYRAIGDADPPASALAPPG